MPKEEHGLFFRKRLQSVFCLGITQTRRARAKGATGLLPIESWLVFWMKNLSIWAAIGLFEHILACFQAKWIERAIYNTVDSIWSQLKSQNVQKFKQNVFLPNIIY